MARVTTNISLIYISSCVGCLLTVVIGNFGVSDAEVPILTLPRNNSHITISSDDSNLQTALLIPGPTTTTTHRFISASNWMQNKNGLRAQTPFHSVTDSTDVLHPGQPHTSVTYQNKRQKRNDFGVLKEDNDETGNYQAPLNQIIVQALTNPEEWSKLREVFDEVDGDLKTLLARKRGSSDRKSSDGVGATVNREESLDTRLDAENPEEHDLHHLDHHVKWNFTYHRVHPLNSAGQPISRGIAAVVSHDIIQSDSVSLSNNDTIVSSKAKVRGASVNIFNKMGTASGSHANDVPNSDHGIFSESRESARDSSMRGFNMFENAREHADLASKDKTSKISAGASSDSDTMFVKAGDIVLPPLKPEVIQVNNRHGSHYASDGNKQSVTRTQLPDEREEKDNFAEQYFLPPIRSRDHPHRHGHVQPNLYPHKLHKHHHHHQDQQQHHWYQHKHFSPNANVQDSLDQPLEQPRPQKLTHHSSYRRAEENKRTSAEK